MEIEVLKYNDLTIMFFYKCSMRLKYKELKFLFGKPEVIKKETIGRISWVLKYDGYYALIYMMTPVEKPKEWDIAYPYGYTKEERKRAHKLLKEELAAREFSIWFNNFNNEE